MVKNHQNPDFWKFSKRPIYGILKTSKLFGWFWDKVKIVRQIGNFDQTGCSACHESASNLQIHKTCLEVEVFFSLPKSQCSWLSWTSLACIIVTWAHTTPPWIYSFPLGLLSILQVKYFNLQLIKAPKNALKGPLQSRRAYFWAF